MESTLETLEVVEETRFGVWFLGTETWFKFVLVHAVRDLCGLIGEPVQADVVLDIGCGQGKSFTLLQQRFRPKRLIGLDTVPEILQWAGQQAERDSVRVELIQGTSQQIPLPDASVDLVFCHQTFHHLTRQEESLAQIKRVLKPGGLLLFAESTRAYIHSWIIRLLFRHPMHLQRSANEYVAMVRAAGFTVDDKDISYPYLWWSRPDLGLFSLLPGYVTPSHGAREETLVNLVARKAAA
jgi:ubiquinone/menaquinone biosynthesis C-methylase UbiE